MPIPSQVMSQMATNVGAKRPGMGSALAGMQSALMKKKPKPKKGKQFQTQSAQ